MRRHFHVGVRVADQFDEKRFFGVAGDNGWTGISAFEETGSGVKVERGFEFFRIGRMTFKAMFCENRSDFFLEKLKAFRREIFSARDQLDAENEDEESEETFCNHRNGKKT